MVKRFFRSHLAASGLGAGLVGLAAAGLIVLGACGGSDDDEVAAPPAPITTLAFAPVAE